MRRYTILTSFRPTAYLKKAKSVSKMRLNMHGMPRTIQAGSRATLLDALRKTPDLTNSKKDCDDGQLEDTNSRLQRHRANVRKPTMSRMSEALLVMQHAPVYLAGATANGLLPLRNIFDISTYRRAYQKTEVP